MDGEAVVRDGDLEAASEMMAARDAIKGGLARRIIGLDGVIDHLLIALFSRGHCLFVGVPGLAKTLLISTLAEVLDLRYNRIQFTPDLMPSDITGTEVLEEDRTTGRREFRFVEGPIFANIILADEINRTPPKTQAALLQSMQEHHVTVGGKTFKLDDPYLVFATQNPIEQEGTYPLPEAQLDRFMFMIEVGYPSIEEEVEIVRSTTSISSGAPGKVLGPDAIRRMQELVPRVPAPEHVVRRAVEIARKTRPGDGASAFVRENLSWGAGPRAAQHMVLGAKARALLNGRTVASVEDVEALALPVLSHRLVMNFHAEAQGVTAAAVAAHVLSDGVA